MSNPRIYTYKITFEEVPYYYYGVHKERKYDEYYMGSPVTHKWVWDFYIPKKQILEVFPYTDAGWLKSQEVEKRIIKPFFNIDKWCLNENCGGIISLEVLKKNGKINGNKVYELGIGIHSLSKEEKTEVGKKGAKICKELGLGINALTSEQLSLHGKKGGKKRKQQLISEDFYSSEKQSNRGKKGGQKVVDLSIGVHGLTAEERSENGRKGGEVNKKNKSGICGLSKEERSENARILALQRWQCTVTGFISTVQGIAIYQRRRGIDTSNRKRIS